MRDILNIFKIKEQLFSLNVKKGKLAVYFAVAIILVLLPLVIKSSFYLHIFILAFLFIILTSSVRLILISGQFSLCHAGFMCIGSYTSALIARDAGISPWLSIFIGALTAALVAFLIAIPFVRVRGIYFAMITLFFGLGVLAFVQIFSKWTGGYAGIGNIPAFFPTVSKIPYYYFFLAATIVCLLILFRLEFSRIGQNWKAVAQSHDIASSIGINVARQRAFVFAIGNLFAGFVGALYAHYFLSIAQLGFSSSVSFNIIVYALVGGIGSFYGPTIGAAVLVMIPAMFRQLNYYVPFIIAGIILIVLFLMPKGITGLPNQIENWMQKRRQEKMDAIKIKEEVFKP
jgi:branched-chain amino acid transport system permease protein